MRTAPFAFALAFLLLPAAPASGQEADEVISKCFDLDNQFEPEESARNCTALLEPGVLPDQNAPLVLFARGEAFREQSEFARAVVDYSAALERGEPLLERPDLDSEYRPALREAMTLARHGRGLAYTGLRDYPRATADYREALRLAPEEPNFGNSLCWNLALQGVDLDEARAACDASLRARPDYPPTLDSRGLVGLKQGRFQDAWNDYDSAVRAAFAATEGPAIEAGERASYLYGRGVAALRLGRTAEGRADIARAEALDARIAQTYADHGVTP